MRGGKGGRESRSKKKASRETLKEVGDGWENDEANGNRKHRGKEDGRGGEKKKVKE